MSQLTDVSVTFRKIAIVGTIGIVSILVLVFLVRTLIAAIKARQPAPQPPKAQPTPTPDTRFGKLPYPQFSVIEQTSAGLNLRLINIEGKPPETSASGTIFSMPKKLPTLLTNDRAQGYAALLGFSGEPEPVDSRIFRYIHRQNPLRTLTLDRVHLNFLMTYDYASHSAIFAPAGSIEGPEAMNSVQVFISKLGFNDSVRTGRITTVYVDYNPETGTFTPVPKIQQARAARVNFFRKPIEPFPILPPGYDESFNYAIYTDTKTLPSGIVELSYKYWPIALDDFATYPLRSSAQAWEELVQGFGTVVRLGRNTPEDVIVRKIYLAYLDTPEPQQYLQPIFVFEGDKDFVAYLPAVIKDWLE